MGNRVDAGKTRAKWITQFWWRDSLARRLAVSVAGCLDREAMSSRLRLPTFDINPCRTTTTTTITTITTTITITTTTNNN